MSHNTLATLPQGPGIQGAGGPGLPSLARASGHLRLNELGEGPQGRSRCLCWARMAGSLCNGARATGGCLELLMSGRILP